MTRQQVLPYLKKMDLEEGEVDGEVVVKETLVRYPTSHKYSLFLGVVTRATIGH